MDSNLTVTRKMGQSAFFAQRKKTAGIAAKKLFLTGLATVLSIVFDFGRTCNNSQSPFKRGLKNLARAAAVLLFIFTAFAPDKVTAQTLFVDGTPSALSTVTGTASSSTSFNVSGSNLTDNITATAPAGFDVSLDNAAWSSSGGQQTITVSGGAVSSTPVYIRLDAGDAINSYSGNVVLTSSGAATIDVSIPASTVSAQPVIYADDSGIAPQTILLGQPASQELVVSGSNLIGGITVTTLAGFDLSLDNSNWSGPGGPVTIAASGGAVSSVPVYIRFDPGDAAGDYAVTIVLNSSGATAVTLRESPWSIAAPVIQPSGTPSALSTKAGTASSSSSFFVSGMNLETFITVTAPPGFDVSTNNSTWSGPGGSVHTNSPGGAPDFATSSTVYVRLDAGDAANGYSGNIVITSTNAVTVDVAIPASTVSPVPAISTTGTPLALSAITGTASSSTSFNVSGSNLTGNITVTAPAGFDVSLDNATWSSSGGTETITASGGAVSSTPVYVRLDAGDAVNNYSGNVVLTSSGAVTVDVGIPGSTVNVQPVISTSGTPSPLSAVTGMGAPSTNFDVSGSNLTGNITVTAPSGFDVSLDNSTWSSSGGSVTITASGGAIPLTPVYIQLDPGDAANNYSGNVVLTSSGAVTVDVGIPGSIVVGPVISTGGTPSALSTITGTASSSTSFFVSGQNLDVIVTVTAPPGFDVSLDNNTWSGPGGQQIITVSDGNLTPTPVFIQLDAGDAANNYSGNVVISSLGAVTADVAMPVSTVYMPVISTTGTPSALSTTSGTASSSTSFDVSGANLTAGNLTVTAPAGFDVSPDNATWSGPGGSFTIAETGTLASTPVYVRLDAGDTVNSYSGNVVLTSSGAVTVNVAMPVSTVIAQPVISTTGTPSALSAISGTASSSTSFNVSGSNLTDNITATAPAGFDVSLDNAAWSSVGGSVTMIASGGAVPSTPVYIRLDAGDAVNSYSGNIVLTSGGAATVEVAMPASAVNTPSPVNPIANQTVANNTATTAVNFTGTAGFFTWQNDTPGIGLAASGAGNIASFTAVNTGSSPVTATITVTPFGGSNYAYIANSGSNNVSVINTATNTVVTTIPVGTNPYGVAVSPDGSTVYVTNTGSGTVSVISTATNTVTATIPVGLSPEGVAVTTNGSFRGEVYVANSGSNTVSVINPATNAVSATIPVGTGLIALAILTGPDAGYVYVVNSGSNNVSVINPATNTVATTIAVGRNLISAAVVPGSTTVYVASSGPLWVINAGNNTVTTMIGDLAGGGVVVSPAGPEAGNVYAASNSGNNVSVINPTNNTLFAEIPVGASPEGLSVSPDGSSVYVANSGSGTVSVISTATNTVTGTINVGSNPISIGNFIASVPGGGAPTTFTITVNPGPVITTTGSLAALSAIHSAASASTTFSVSGANLTAGITVTPPAGFEVSTDGNNFSGTVTVGAAGTIASTPVYVRLAAADAAGNYAGNIVLSSAGAASVNVAIPLSTVKSTDATLSNLTLNAGLLTPSFSAGTTSYTRNLVNGVQAVTIVPTADDPAASILVNGTETVVSGATSNPIPVSVGSNTITILVTAQDGSTTKTYTLTLIRAGARNDLLTSLKLSRGTLSPVFTGANTSYTSSVANGTSSLTLTPVSADPNATMLLNGATPITSGIASAPIALAVGANTITVQVTAQNDTATRTYTVTVTRAASKNDNLASLKVSRGALSPVFSGANTSYTASVVSGVSSMTVTPTAADADASILVNGTDDVTSGTASGPIVLAVGPNTITVKVTAADGVTNQTYKLTVTRATGSADGYDPGISVVKPTETSTLADDGILVHQGVSPNGDGINDFLQIDNIGQFPDNKLSIMNRNGQLVYEATGYDNSSKVFDGHSNKNGQMQLPGTYFYQLDYTVKGITKTKTGFIVLKY